MADETMREQLQVVREDVAYIRAKIDALPDHENRLRTLEKRQLGVFGSALATLVALLGIHIS